MEITIEPEVITELRKRVAKANELSKFNREIGFGNRGNHVLGAFLTGVLREYDKVVNELSRWKTGDWCDMCDRPQWVTADGSHMCKNINELQLQNTTLQMYHRVIDEIATVLGYRMGDTFEPKALIKQVEQLVAYAELAKENRTAMATLAAVEAERDMVIAACRGTQMDTSGIRAVKELTNRTVKAESILATLRKPSDAMLNAMSVAAEKANVWVSTAPITSQELQNRLWIAGMNAAIAVAEKEVNDGLSG